MDTQDATALAARDWAMVAHLSALVGLIGIVAGVVLLIVVGVMCVVMPIVAAVQAKRGVHYRYPLSLRLVK